LDKSLETKRILGAHILKIAEINAKKIKLDNEILLPLSTKIAELTNEIKERESSYIKDLKAAQYELRDNKKAYILSVQTGFDKMTTELLLVTGKINLELGNSFQSALLTYIKRVDEIDAVYPKELKAADDIRIKKKQALKDIAKYQNTPKSIKDQIIKLEASYKA